MAENIVENVIHNLLQDKEIHGDSVKWANWMSVLILTTCKYCVEHHGTIVDISLLENKTFVEAHPNCQCLYVPMRTKLKGTATEQGRDGADAYIADHQELPSYYVDKETAYAAGWQTKKKTLSAVLPGKMIGGDLYYDDDSKLPSAPGRIWREADINYVNGKRNRHRILFSNDGLIFVTYDHYQTFYELIS